MQALQIPKVRLIVRQNDAVCFKGPLSSSCRRALHVHHHHGCSGCSRKSSSLTSCRHMCAHSRRLSQHLTCRGLSAAGSTGSGAAGGAGGLGAGQRRSFDDEGELDGQLAEELSSIADPARLQQMAKTLELTWRITKGGQATPETCDACSGSAEQECQWCHGTGYLMVGDTLYATGTKQTNKCPVCKGTGYCKCEHCRGTGKRARWLGSNPTIES